MLFHEEVCIFQHKYSRSDVLNPSACMQIVLAGAALAVILLHEYIMIVWVVLGTATAAVCAGPTILSYIRQPAKKQQKDMKSEQYRASDTPEVTHRSMTNDGAAVHRETVNERLSHGSDHMV